MLLEIFDNSWLVYAPDQDSNCYHLMSSKEKHVVHSIFQRIFMGLISDVVLQARTVALPFFHMNMFRRQSLVFTLTEFDNI